MRIGFCGAGGTGKSTTAKLLAQEIGMPLVPSPSRSCFKKHGVKTEDDQNAMSPEQRYSLQYDIFHAIGILYMEHETGIFDRTLLDNFNYLMHRCHDIVQKDTLDYMEQTTMLSLMDPNTKVFFFPLYDWKIESDGMRTQQVAPRVSADLVIRGFLDKHKIPYWHVGNITVEKRVEHIKRILGYA